MPRVLLVEDDPGVRGALELGPALFGYEVVAVGTALEALEKISGVDLVVLDVLLPDRDGFQLLREIRARSPVPVRMTLPRPPGGGGGGAPAWPRLKTSASYAHEPDEEAV